MKALLSSYLIVLSSLAAVASGAADKDGWIVFSPSQAPDTLKASKDTLPNRAQPQPLVQTDLSLPQVIPPSPAAMEISKGTTLFR